MSCTQMAARAARGAHAKLSQSSLWMPVAHRYWAVAIPMFLCVTALTIGVLYAGYSLYLADDAAELAGRSYSVFSRVCLILVTVVRCFGSQWIQWYHKATLCY